MTAGAALGTFTFLFLAAMALLTALERWPKLDRFFGRRSAEKAAVRRAELKAVLGEQYEQTHFGIQLLVAAVLAVLTTGLLALIAWTISS